MELSFEQLPAAVGKMLLKLEDIERLLINHSSKPIESCDILTIQEAASFTHLSVPTLYGLVSRALIPHMKKGKRLYFSKKELTDWIKTGRKKTTAEIAVEAETFINNSQTKRRQLV